MWIWQHPQTLTYVLFSKITVSEDVDLATPSNDGGLDREIAVVSEDVDLATPSNNQEGL